MDGRRLSSCRQDALSSIPAVASELSPDPRMLARPAALRQPADLSAHHGPLSSAIEYCSTGSFYYGSSPSADLSGSCSRQRSTTFCRGGALTAAGSEVGDDDDDDGHVASSEEEESKPRIWSLADVATSCRGTIRAGNGSAASCMTAGTGIGELAQNGGGSGGGAGGFLPPWPSSGYYCSPTATAGSSGLYPSYYQTAAAAAVVAQQRPGAGFRPSEMLPDSAARHHPHQLLTQDQVYLHQQQRSIGALSSRNSSFSPGSCSQQPAVAAAAAASSQFNDVIGFCAAGSCPHSFFAINLCSLHK